MLKDFGIDGIYIVHAKKGYEVHQKRIEKIFGALNMPHEFVTDGDISNFNPHLLHKYFCEPIEKKLSKGILSCTLNHIFCYEKMVANNDRFALIFENDPFFLGDFLKKIKQVAKEADTLEPGFLISLENKHCAFRISEK